MKRKLTAIFLSALMSITCVVPSLGEEATVFEADAYEEDASTAEADAYEEEEGTAEADTFVNEEGTAETDVYVEEDTAEAEVTVDLSDETASGASVELWNDGLPEIGDELYGFVVTGRGEIKDLDARTVTLSHSYSGATVMLINNDDQELGFAIGYRTPNVDGSERNHVLEHVVVSDSDKYPSTQLSFDIIYNAFNTFVNAKTDNFVTTQELYSYSSAQLKIMMDACLSGLVDPKSIENENYFKREGIRYSLDSPESDIKIEGTVFTEDYKGVSDFYSGMHKKFFETLYPGTFVNNAMDILSNYKLLTYENIKDAYETFYKFDNSIMVLYGDIDYREYLEFLDREYLSQHGGSNIDISDYIKEVEPSFKEDVVYIPMVEGAEDTSAVLYGIDITDWDFEDIIKVEQISQLFADSESVINSHLSQAGINANLSCYEFFACSKDYLVFVLENIEPGQRHRAMETIREALADVAENGENKSYNELYNESSEKDELRELILSAQQVEPYEYVYNSCLYWAEYNITDYSDVIDMAVKQLLEDDEPIVKDIAGRLLAEENTALMAAVSDPGAIEDMVAQIDADLKEMKASMTPEEIDKLVEETAAFNKWNSTQVVNTDVVVSPDTLTMTDLYPNVRENTLGDIKVYSVEEDVEAGFYRLCFDMSGLSQEELHYFGLYVELIKRLGTDKYTREELEELKDRYLRGSELMMIYGKVDGSEEEIPMLSVSWYCKNEDYETALELLLHIMDNVQYGSREDMISHIEEIMPLYSFADAYRSNYVMYMMAARTINEAGQMFEYLYGPKFYDFMANELIAVKASESSYEDLLERLVSVEEKLLTKTNIKSCIISDREGISLAEETNDRILNQLPEARWERQTYDLGEVNKNIGLINDSTVQYTYFSGALPSDFKGEYIPYIYMIESLYTNPLLRFSGNVYTSYTGMVWGKPTDNSLMSYTDTDLDVSYTEKVTRSMAEGIRNIEINREELNSYIVAAYRDIYDMIYSSRSNYHNAGLALYYAIMGMDINEEMNRWTGEISKSTSANRDAAADCIQGIAENGCFVAIGNESAINAKRDMFDEVIDLRYPNITTTEATTETTTEAVTEEQTETTTKTAAVGSGGGSYKATVTTEADTQTTTESISEVTTDSTYVNNFVDVKDSDWFKSAVDFVGENDLMVGVDDTHFGPNMPLTRAMLVTILHRMEGSPDAQESDFKDVPEDSWYKYAVDWGREKGIVYGVTEDSFAPDEPVTREQMAAIICRYADHKGMDISSDISLTYTDREDISAYALPAITWVTDMGLMQGDKGLFRPGDNSTRAEVAQIISTTFDMLNTIKG